MKKVLVLMFVQLIAFAATAQVSDYVKGSYGSIMNCRDQNGNFLPGSITLYGAPGNVTELGLSQEEIRGFEPSIADGTKMNYMKLINETTNMILTVDLSLLNDENMSATGRVSVRRGESITHYDNCSVWIASDSH